MKPEPLGWLSARLDEAHRLAGGGQFALARRRALSVLARGGDAHPDVRAAVAQALADIAGRALAGNALDEAERCLRAALRHRPDFADLHHRLATLLEAAGRLEEARGELLEALRINPNYVAAGVNLALLDARLGNLGEALETLRRLEHSKRPAEAETFHQGVRSMQQADWEEAGALLRRAYGLGERSLDASLSRFLHLVREGDLGQARALLREVVAEHPDYADVHYLLGCVELELACAADALGSLAQALELNPDFHAARLQLARALDAVGQMAMAQEQVQAVLQQDPRHPAALRAQERWLPKHRGEGGQMPLDPQRGSGQSNRRESRS